MQVNLPKTGYKTYCKVHLVSQYLTGGNETARIGVDDVDADKELAPRCTKSVGRMRTFPASLSCLHRRRLRYRICLMEVEQE